jgi:Flp pilus assembly protein TadG
MRRLISRRGQSTVEYMLLLSVLAMAMIVALDYFGNPQGDVQQAAAQLAPKYAAGLTTDGSGNGGNGLQAN